MDTLGVAGNLISSGVQAAARFLPEPAVRGLDAVSSVVGGQQSNVVELSSSYQDLINRQIETQLEMQQVTFISNIERSQHESRMAAVRNVRVA